MLEKKGLVKLVEECGELIQIASKKMVCMDTDEHFDRKGPLSERLTEEAGDVLAALEIVVENFGLPREDILLQKEKKLALFRKWMDE